MIYSYYILHEVYLLKYRQENSNKVKYYIRYLMKYAEIVTKKELMVTYRESEAAVR